MEYGDNKIRKPHKDEILGTGEQDIPNFIFNDSLI